MSGVPSAAARCSGPVSPPMTSAARLRSAGQLAQVGRRRDLGADRSARALLRPAPRPRALARRCAAANSAKALDRPLLSGFPAPGSRRSIRDRVKLAAGRRRTARSRPRARARSRRSARASCRFHSTTCLDGSIADVPIDEQRRRFLADDVARESEAIARAAGARDQRRLDQPLKVDRGVESANVRATRAAMLRERPPLQRDGDRASRRATISTSSAIRRLDHPGDLRLRSASRNATTAGIVWMTSPSAERRMTRRRMRRGVRHRRRIVSSNSVVEWSFGSPTIATRPAIRPHDRALRAPVRRVVGPFAVDVGLEVADEPRRAALVKDGHVRHAADRGDDLGALALRSSPDGPRPSARAPIRRR